MPEGQHIVYFIWHIRPNLAEIKFSLISHCSLFAFFDFRDEPLGNFQHTVNPGWIIALWNDTKRGHRSAFFRVLKIAQPPIKLSVRSATLNLYSGTAVGS